MFYVVRDTSVVEREKQCLDENVREEYLKDIHTSETDVMEKSRIYKHVFVKRIVPQKCLYSE